MKPLVLTSAHGGEEFHLLAGEMIRSLRTHYAGEIAVLTDSPRDYGASVEVLPADFSEPAKLRIEAWKPLDGYDVVLWCDTDVFWAKSPEWLLRAPRPTVSVEGYPLTRSGWNRKVIPRDVDCRAFPCINSGVMAFPAGTYAGIARLWLEAWRRERAKVGPWDQSVLQALVVAGALEMDYWPAGTVSFPLLRGAANDPGAVCYHLCGWRHNERNKGNLLRMMSDLNHKADFRAVLARGNHYYVGAS